MKVTLRQLNAAMSVAEYFKDKAPDGFVSYCKEAIETLLRIKLNEWDFKNEKLAIFIIETAKIGEQRSKFSRNNQR